ncbi:MAG: exo-alpha-sialidase [Bacteroidales bacterium]|nr:exo-alpha-sialidase [Bacteroidales bacterium]
MKTKPNILLLLFILFISVGCKQQSAFRKGIITEEFIFDSAAFPSCHSATIAETPKGLVVAFFGGTYERHPDVCIYVSRQEKGKWTAPEEIANGIINDTLRYPTWNPVLFQVPEGDLILFYKVGPSPSSWQGMLKRSKDQGKTWSKPDSLPEGFIGPVKNKPVLLDNGTILCGSSTENYGWKIHFETTKDHAISWERSDPVNDGIIYQAIQPTILKYNNGRLQILCRSMNCMILESWSADTGKTWSLLKESNLPNNNSGIDAVSLANGRQLLVYNHVKTPVNANKGYRTPLNVAISKDGKIWYAALVLEDSETGQYSYPSVIQSADAMVHVVYTWRREKIKYVKINPKKLTTKKIKNEKWPIKITKH